MPAEYKVASQNTKGLYRFDNSAGILNALRLGSEDVEDGDIQRAENRRGPRDDDHVGTEARRRFQARSSFVKRRIPRPQPPGHGSDKPMIVDFHDATDSRYVPEIRLVGWPIILPALVRAAPFGAREKRTLKN